MLLGMFVGAWFGNGILTGANAKPAAIGLGIVLIAYALIGLSKVKFSVAAQKRNLARADRRRVDGRCDGGDRRVRDSRFALSAVHRFREG